MTMAVVAAIITFLLGATAGFILTMIVVAFSATRKEQEERRLKEEISRNLRRRKAKVDERDGL